MLPSLLSLFVLEEICGRLHSRFTCLCGYLIVVLTTCVGYFMPHGIPAGDLESVWGCLCMAGHVWLKPDNNRTRQFVLLWLSLVYHDLSAEMLQAHILSSAHIYVSWIARVAILLAVLDILFYRKTKALPAALATQGASIILGMIWAFDAPGWDSLWHWDYIETCALLTWISLWALYRTEDRFWGYIAISLQIIQSLVLYAHIGMPDISSHQYVSGAKLEWLFGHALWMTGMICCRRPNKSETKNTGTALILERSSGFLMIGLVITGGFFTPISAWSIQLSIFVILTWIILIVSDTYTHSKKLALISAGLLAIIPMYFLNVQFDAFWAKTDGNTWNLYGIHNIKQIDECVQYQFIIDINHAQIVEMPYTSCHHRSKLEQYKYLIDNHRIVRAQIIEYKPKDGILIRKSDVTPHTVYMIFIIILWIWGTASTFRRLNSPRSVLKLPNTIP